jgi:hypothetical protein
MPVLFRGSFQQIAWLVVKKGKEGQVSSTPGANSRWQSASLLLHRMRKLHVFGPLPCRPCQYGLEIAQLAIHPLLPPI